ncbi:MAG TPA: hypothetical protein VD884_13270 [Ohtaekwangia sp.]|nr:hypothetical protein [Ohtaekwangia sp.]
MTFDKEGAELKKLRKKPSWSRYYFNLKTGQYAHLEGSPLAIKDIETRQWKRQKVRTKRISKSEYDEKRPKGVLFGYGCPYSPTRQRLGKKSNAPAFHEVTFVYWAVEEKPLV